jgi:hypothetical protein
LLGNLGGIGPAARARNLSENNDDSAFIAENVFADYWVQMGLSGLILGIGFFIALFLETQKPQKIFIASAFLMANMATIFDMSPISILFFIIFVLFSNRSINSSET